MGDTFITITIILTITNFKVKAFSTGAPVEVCEDLMPQHAEDPQIDNFPYEIKANDSRVKPFQKLNVTISSPRGITFKGFIIQARVGDIPHGHFEDAEGVKLMTCNKKNQVLCFLKYL